MSKKYYAVRSGRVPGIYETWDECKKQTHKFEGAKFKSFENLDDAKKFMETGDYNIEGKKVSKGANQESFREIEDLFTENIREKAKRDNNDFRDLSSYKGLIAYVDGSYNEETNTSGYGMVLVVNDEPIYEEYKSFKNHEFNEHRNVFGEVVGSTRAVEYAIKNGYKSVLIAYDYTGIRYWATGEWNRNNDMTKRYHKFMQDKMNEIEINFQKIKAHATEENGGNKYNDYADELAKKSVGVIPAT